MLQQLSSNQMCLALIAFGLVNEPVRDSPRYSTSTVGLSLLCVTTCTVFVVENCIIHDLNVHCALEAVVQKLMSDTELTVQSSHYHSTYKVDLCLASSQDWLLICYSLLDLQHLRH